MVSTSVPESARWSARRPVTRLGLIAALALGLAGCQYYAPHEQPDPTSAEAQTRETAQRVQGRQVMRAQAAPQWRIPTGMTETGAVCQDWLDPCWESATTAVASTLPGGRPQPATAQTFRGTLPCPAGTGCEAQHVVLQLNSAQSWLARMTPTQGAPYELSGCWMRGAEGPHEFVLSQVGGAPFAVLLATDNNTLAWRDINAPAAVVQHRLTRQPDAAQFNQAAPSCPAG